MSTIFIRVWPLIVALLPVSAFSQEAIRTDLLTNIGNSFSPAKCLRIDDSYYLYQKYDSGYSQSSELRRYNYLLSPTKDLVNLNEMATGFKSIEVVRFGTKILHLGEISRNDSIVYVFQAIDPITFNRSALKRIGGYENSKLSNKQALVKFVKSPNGDKLGIVEINPAKKSGKLRLILHDIDSRNQIRSSRKIEFDHAVTKSQIDEIVYSDQGDLIVLARILGSDDYSFEIVLIKNGREQRLLKVIKNADEPTIGFAEDGSFYFLAPFSSVPTRLTQGFRLSSYDAVTYDVIKSTFYGFDIDFYKRITNPRWHKKLMADQKKGQLLARDRITFHRLLELGDNKLIIGHSNPKGSSSEKVFAFCFDSEMKLKWSDWFVAGSKEIGISLVLGAAYVTFEGDENIKSKDNTTLGFMTLKITRSGFDPPKKYLTYGDFHEPRLKLIPSEDSDELFFYKLSRSKESEENKQEYYLYKLAEPLGKYR